MDDWERSWKAFEKELSKDFSRELQDKLNSVESLLKTLDFEEVNGMPAQLLKEEQRIWILQEISNIYYDGECYSINAEALAEWEKEHFNSDGSREVFKEFAYCYGEFLSGISREDCVECWMSALEHWRRVKKTADSKPSRKSNIKNEGSASGNTGRRSSIAYNDRKGHMKDFLAAMESMNVAEGSERRFTYGSLKRDGFICINIEDDEYRVLSTEELLENKWYLENGYKCIVIKGRVGSGKSILGCRLAENIIISLGREQWCLVWSSQFTEGQFGKNSEKYLSKFLNKSLPKRGKMVVVIDDMGELSAKGKLKNISKLFEAAQYYNATLIITCRRAFAEKLSDERMPITIVWRMLELDIKDSERDSVIQELPVKEEMNEVRKSPMFLDEMNKRIDAYEETKEYFEILGNSYLFQEACYKALMRRENIKNRINDSDIECLEMFMEEVAFQMYRYHGGPVTLDICTRVLPDEEKLQKLIKTEIFLEMIEVDKQLKENYREWDIKGFSYSWLKSYFTTRMIIDAYLQNDRVKMEVINNIKVDEKNKKMIETLYNKLPADKREVIEKNALKPAE